MQIRVHVRIGNLLVLLRVLWDARSIHSEKWISTGKIKVQLAWNRSFSFSTKSRIALVYYPWLYVYYTLNFFDRYSENNRIRIISYVSFRYIYIFFIIIINNWSLIIPFYMIYRYLSSMQNIDYCFEASLSFSLLTKRSLMVHCLRE